MLHYQYPAIILLLFLASLVAGCAIGPDPDAARIHPIAITSTSSPTQALLPSPTTTRQSLSIPIQPTQVRPTLSSTSLPTARPLVPETYCPNPVTTFLEAADCLDQQIQQDGLYVAWTSRACLMIMMEDSTPGGFDIAIRERHEPPCPGDPNVAPIVDRFRVTRSGLILWLSYDSPAEYIDYQYVVLERLP